MQWVTVSSCRTVFLSLKLSLSRLSLRSEVHSRVSISSCRTACLGLSLSLSLSMNLSSQVHTHFFGFVFSLCEDSYIYDKRSIGNGVGHCPAHRQTVPAIDLAASHGQGAYVYVRRVKLIFEAKEESQGISDASHFWTDFSIHVQKYKTCFATFGWVFEICCKFGRKI